CPSGAVAILRDAVVAHGLLDGRKVPGLVGALRVLRPFHAVAGLRATPLKVLERAAMRAWHKVFPLITAQVFLPLDGFLDRRRGRVKVLTLILIGLRPVP